MITSIYRGGLGNQLFQVATGYALAKDNNTDYFIDKTNHTEIGQGNTIDHYINSIFEKSPTNDLFDGSRPNYKESQFNYCPIPFQANMILDGYFQSEKYFKNYKATLNHLFGFDDINESNTSEVSCVIQIRTGDFLSNYIFNVVTPSYFREALELIKSKYNNVKFVVVSDDWSRAASYLPTDNVYQVSRGSELDDLRLMSKADCCIISNSSFGWWGSYLGKDKLTVVPDKWFNNSERPEYEDIYRDEMVRIKI